MPVRIVQSKQNARLKELRRAFSRAGRDSGGLAAIEGPHLLQEAARAGLRLRTVFVRMGAEPDGVSGPEAGGLEETELLFVPAEIFDSIVETETPQPVAALVELPSWTWTDALTGKAGGKPLVVVLAGVQDPGNLGTLVRSAEAFGASGVVSLPGTVSAWNAKAVRASAGSVFRVPVMAAGADACFARLREAGVRIWTTGAEAAMREATQAGEADLRGAVALMIGNEGNGVPAEVAAQADGAITIPCPGPVESLNAAVAASVLLYEASRQRSSLVSHPFSIAASGAGEWMGHGEGMVHGEKIPHGEKAGRGKSAAKKKARSRR